MKKIITIVMLSFGFSLMASAQLNVSGCTTINGVQICGTNNPGATQGAIPGSTITNTAGGAIGGNLMALIASAQGIINMLVPFGIGLAVVALFYGIIMFMFTKDQAVDHQKWLKFMGMALVGLFVMVSVWGLINFMGSLVGVGQGGGIPVPALPVTPRVY